MRKSKDLAYGLMLTLGTIQDEMNKGGDAPTKEEVDNMYDLAFELYELLDDEDDYPGDYVPDKTPDELWLEAQSNEAETIYFNS